MHISKKIEGEKSPEENKTPEKTSRISVVKEGQEKQEETEETKRLSMTKEGDPIQKEGKKDKKKETLQLPEWFIRHFGKDILQQIKENPNLTLPFEEKEMPLEEWLVKSLKTILPSSNLDSVIKNIEKEESTKDKEKLSLQNALDKAEAEMLKAQQELKAAQARVDDAEVALFRNKKELESRYPVKEMLKALTATEDQAIKTILEDALEEPDDQLAAFVFHFLNGWHYVKGAHFAAQGSEEEKMELLYQALSFLLTRLKGLTCTARRSLLDEVADFASAASKDFQFVSPERSTQIDPSIHDAVGVGGSAIKEGYSFAVIRKDTRSTVKYASVSTA
ncbi:hypothetical protein V6R21_09020 [Limibacter armeniacum]|uniref:hypothetical protein n=1 Tax=Limibacter armeniacum TaxID=466084 RepID=UPI002FE67EBC